VEAKNQFITRRAEGFKQTMAGIERAIGLQFDSVKVNVVVMNGFNDDVRDYDWGFTFRVGIVRFRGVRQGTPD
jgi:hypothetical protein